jgi:tetratricopeptide (TPR) repeat protein
MSRMSGACGLVVVLSFALPAAAQERPAFLDVPPRPAGGPPPSADQVRALEEMERELEAIERAGGAYDDVVRGIVERDHASRRRAVESAHRERVTHAMSREVEARDRAIALFERFVTQYPTDPTYTPDAMLRLGELHYEHSTDAAVAADAEQADYGSTIAIYRALAERFPAYARIDAVHYLLGYCLAQTGRVDEALASWVRLACAGSPGAASATPPYSGCVPVRAGSDFLAETWLRIGEHHFDLDVAPGALDRAAAAYEHALEDRTSRVYSLALYKLAWAHYRASRYAESVERFAQLVEWSDAEEVRTGRAGSELRAEAVQYLALSFTYDDWNEDGTADHEQGIVPDRLARLRDAHLLRQDRPWTADVYLAVGGIYFDEARYPEAIAVWQETARRWPRDHRLPEIVRRVAIAQQRMGSASEAERTRERLGEYGPGSEWADHNEPLHPREVEAARRLAQQALAADAIRRHQAAQRLRAAGQGGAEAEYAAAVDRYRRFLGAHPESPDAYTMQYDLADALFWSGRYEEAAAEFERVRDSTFDDRLEPEAARMVVESLRRVLEDAVARGEVSLRDEPAPSPTTIPDLAQRVAHAREIYLARIESSRDRAGVRAGYAYDDALLLLRYGWRDLARPRFATLYEQHCATEVGSLAWRQLRNIAIEAGDTDEVLRLGDDSDARPCSFGLASATPPTGAACGTPECDRDPSCLRYCDRFTVGVNAPQRDEQGARRIVTEVGRMPDHPSAAPALLRAAAILAEAHREEAAATVYQRIVDDYGTAHAVDADQDRAIDRAVAEAWFRLGQRASRTFDTERAIAAYRALASSDRFSRTTDPTVQRFRADALVNAALLLEAQEDFAAARELYARAAESPPAAMEAPDRRRAAFRAAEMLARRGEWPAALRAMRDFLRAHERDADGETIVAAYARIAEAQSHGGTRAQRLAALRDVVAACERTHGTPGSASAEHAARAAFELAEAEAGSAAFTVDPGRPRTLEAYVERLQVEIARGRSDATRAAAAYRRVLAYGRPAWSIAALAREGRIEETLARGILDAPFVVPADLARQLRRVPADRRAQLAAEIEDRIRARLSELADPIECAAIARYVLASRAARAGSVDDERSRFALDRLRAYGEERIAGCIEAERARDPSFAPYVPGELSRARRAPMPPIDEGAPSLAD